MLTGHLPADNPTKKPCPSFTHTHFYLVKFAGKEGIQYAAIDSSLQFVLPQQKEYQIVGGYGCSNKLIVRRQQDSFYAVTNTLLRL